MEAIVVVGAVVDGVVVVVVETGYNCLALLCLLVVAMDDEAVITKTPGDVPIKTKE